jgi:tetratricopeptide (TPR) repeat protein
LVYHQLLQRAESPDLYFNIALLYLKLQKWDKALYALQTAEQISDQPQPRVHYYLGRVFQEQKKINQANQQFETALRLFEEGMDDTIDGRTPYPCKAIIHASAAAATGEWRRCNEILGEHLVELAGTQSDLLSDVEVIKGNVDFLLPLRFRVGTKPSDQLTWKMEQIDSVFQLKHQLLDQFLAAQASNQLGDALTMGNAYLKIDPELSAVRERITEELVNN